MRARVVDVLMYGTGTGDTRREPDVGGLEGKTIVHTIAGDTNGLTKTAVGHNVNPLVLRGRSG
jgi:hypothetical protein